MVLRIDGQHPTDRDYPSAVTLSIIYKEATITPEAKKFLDFVKTGEGANPACQHGQCSHRRVRTSSALPRLSSLSTRLVVAVLATATAAFTVSFGLTIWRLNQGLDAPGRAACRLSEDKLGAGARWRGAACGRARGDAVRHSSGARLESIAQRADIMKAVSTGTSIAISELLGRAARAADLDGILVVDAKLRVLGADKQRQGRHPGGHQALRPIRSPQHIQPIAGRQRPEAAARAAPHRRARRQTRQGARHA